MKKIYRTIQKYLNYFLIKIFSWFLKFFNYKIVPNLADLKEFNFDYSKNTRRLVFKNSENSFGKIIVDTSFFNSNLCKEGREFNTNKSPYNLVGHRSGYTGLYYLLFSQIRKHNLIIGEIGIEKNASTKLWRNFFINSEIHGFEFEENKIDNAIKDKLPNTFYHKINVDDPNSIKKAFEETNKKFDIIIDDSTHLFNHQINIIYNVKDFLNENSILIIEDIYKDRKGYEEKMYYDQILQIKEEFENIFFIETPHINNFTASWKNEKMLVLVKNKN